MKTSGMQSRVWISFLRPQAADFIRARRAIRASSVCFAHTLEPHVSILQQRIQFHTTRPRSNHFHHKPRVYVVINLHNKYHGKCGKHLVRTYQLPDLLASVRRIMQPSFFKIQTFIHMTDCALGSVWSSLMNSCKAPHILTGRVSPLARGSAAS